MKKVHSKRTRKGFEVISMRSSEIEKATAMVLRASALVDVAEDPMGALLFIQQLFVAGLTLGTRFAPGMVKAAMLAAQDQVATKGNQEHV